LRLGAETLHPFRGIVAIKSRQVDARDCLEKPRRLRIVLDGPPARQGRNAPFRGGKIDPDLVDPIQLEGAAAVARDRVRAPLAAIMRMRRYSRRMLYQVTLRHRNAMRS